jgi:hypothetical protein
LVIEDELCVDKKDFFSWQCTCFMLKLWNRYRY